MTPSPRRAYARALINGVPTLLSATATPDGRLVLAAVEDRPLRIELLDVDESHGVGHLGVVAASRARAGTGAGRTTAGGEGAVGDNTKGRIT